MIQKGSYLFPMDNSGITVVGVFHIYRGINRTVGHYGTFFKVSVKQTLIPFIVLKKSKFKSFLILSVFRQRKVDGSEIRFKTNSCVLLKRRLTPVGKEIIGPINFNIRRKRFVSSFSTAI